jgi:hypothetical protein
MQNGIVGDAGGGTVAIKAAILACVRVTVAILSCSISSWLKVSGRGFFLGAIWDLGSWKTKNEDTTNWKKKSVSAKHNQSIIVVVKNRT